MGSGEKVMAQRLSPDRGNWEELERRPWASSAVITKPGTVVPIKQDQPSKAEGQFKRMDFNVRQD